MMTVHSEDRRNKELMNVPKEIPMMLLNEEWAIRNHGQTLKRLNERGGLGVLEMLNIIHKRKWGYGTESQDCVDELNSIISAHING